jgi:aspartate/methionine/tyrosine aminotransferase
MYRGLEYDPEARLPSGCELSARAITLGGLSKTYGLPGLRSGWLVVRDEQLRQRLLGWKDYTSICSSAPSELLAEIAIGIADALAERCRSIVLENLGRADVFFREWSHRLRWNRPQAGSVALVGLRHGSAEAFCAEALERRGVVLLPGPCLGADDHHFRIGLGRQSFATCLGQLAELLELQQLVAAARGDQ